MLFASEIFFEFFNFFDEIRIFLLDFYLFCHNLVLNLENLI